VTEKNKKNTPYKEAATARPRYLIAFDLDATVLPKIDEIDERTVRAFRAAHGQGHIPVIASARHYNMIRWVYEAMGLDSPVCAINGAHVFHPRDEAFAPSERSISPRRTRRIIEAAFEYKCHIPMYIEYKNALWYTEGNHGKYYRVRIDTSEPSTFFAHTTIPETPASRIIITPPDTRAAREIEALIAADTSGEVVAVSWDFLQLAEDVSNIRMSLCSAGTDKWYAIERIAAYYGIPREDIYAFGDMWNDFLMLENSGRGYALRGSEAERESKAKYVTRYTCAECGVADVIEREILR
jgi:Cof subfamily protein (haloacid dehalogenase superfamily)